MINRSYMARQLLLHRAAMPVQNALEYLVGLQAQDVMPPFVSLWSRLEEFAPGHLAEPMLQREVVRLTLMRNTVHMVSKRDALRIRPLMQVELNKAVIGAGPRRDAVAGIEPDELAGWGQRVLAAEGSGMGDLREAAARDWPDRDARLVAQSAVWLLPCTQVPPRGLWRRNDRPRWALADRWLGDDFETSYPVDDLVLRFIRAFGPVTVTDIQTWSRLTGLRPVIERLRPGLVMLRDEAGRELFDVPESPWPDPATPVPVRFLGAFDNLWLAHKDRSRVVDKRYWPLVMTSNGVGRPTILIDGFLSARYRVNEKKDRALLEIEPFRPLTNHETAEVEAEGARLLEFLDPGLRHDITFVPPSK
jgi:hypothetical protein